MKITPTFDLTLFLILFFSCIFMTMQSYAAEQSPADAPPNVRNLDEDANEPAVTNIEKERVKQTEQTSQQGEQTEIKVHNNIGTYIVRPNQSVGTSLPGDAQSSSNHAVQWVVKTWGKTKNTNPATDTPPTLQPNPDSQPTTTPD